MNCPSCLQNYSNTDLQRMPRVLLLCGHTFCHQCIEQQLINQTITCYTCHKISQASSVDIFPVNETLMKFITTAMPREEPLCKQHNKKIDIFCQKDHKLLCSECLLHSHQHHKMVTVAQKAEKERNILKDSLNKIQQTLQQYKNSEASTLNQQRDIQHAFLDCQATANLFFQTIQEEITRLQKKQLEKLTSKKEEILKKLAMQQDEIQEQIHFLTEVQQIHNELSQLTDAQFLILNDKRNFIAESAKHKLTRYSCISLEFKKVGCLQEIAKSIQEMLSLENNRISCSPATRKQKQPTVLEVNLKEQYQKRKGTNTLKIKPTKKTINILAEKEKIGEGLPYRNNSLSEKEPKIDIRPREHSFTYQKEDFNSSIMSLSELSQNFTPISSVRSFLQSSRNSLNSQFDSFFEDTTLKNTFVQFSALSLEDCVYHIGGLTNTDIEKYHPETGYSDRCSANAQFRRRGFHCVILKVKGIDKCLLIGGVSSGKSPVSDIYQFNFKQEKILKSPLKLNQPRISFGCVTKQEELFILGGKINQRPVNSFEKYKIQNKELISIKMPNMGQAREDLACCIGFDGFLYAFGGITLSNDSTNSAERFSWEKQSWEVIKPMRYNRISFTAVATPGGIFVIGGHTTKKYLKQVQFFDLQEKKWIEKAPLANARCYHSAILSRDYQTITIFGGFFQNNELDSIQIYDISKNEWSSGGRMRQKRCLHASISSSK